MVKVAGHWELSWNTPIKEAELWNLPLRDMGIKDWYMHPISGIHQREAKVTLHEKPSMKEIIEENKDLVHVYFEPENPARPHNAESLVNFEHPEDALYIFGSAHFDPVRNIRENDKVVYLPTVENSGILWPHQVLVTVMYDRMLKDGSYD